jgi:hypothetical protein
MNINDTNFFPIKSKYLKIWKMFLIIQCLSSLLFIITLIQKDVDDIRLSSWAWGIVSTGFTLYMLPRFIKYSGRMGLFLGRASIEYHEPFRSRTFFKSQIHTVDDYQKSIVIADNKRNRLLVVSPDFLDNSLEVRGALLSLDFQHQK